MLQSDSARQRPRHRHPLVVAVSLALVVACQSDSDTSRPSTTSSAGLVLPPDDEILTKAYAAGPRTPADFYADPRLGGDTAASVHHVDSVDVLDPTSTAAVSATRYELCSDDVAEALAWSQLDQAHRHTPANLVETAETEHYFEFTYVRDDLPGWLGHARVLRCAWLDRSGTDADAVDGPAGRINQRPLNGRLLKTAGEYLWTFSRFNNQPHVVLASAAAADGAGWRLTLTLATLTPGAGTEAGCDRIDVRDWELAMDSGGALVWALRPVKSMDARSGSGTPERC